MLSCSGASLGISNLEWSHDLRNQCEGGSWTAGGGAGEGSMFVPEQRRGIAALNPALAFGEALPSCGINAQQFL